MTFFPPNCFSLILSFMPTTKPARDHSRRVATVIKLSIDAATEEVDWFLEAFLGKRPIVPTLSIYEISAKYYGFTCHGARNHGRLNRRRQYKYKRVAPHHVRQAVSAFQYNRRNDPELLYDCAFIKHLKEYNLPHISHKYNTLHLEKWDEEAEEGSFYRRHILQYEIKKQINPFGGIYEIKTLPKACELQQYCRDNKMKGFSKHKKNELVTFIMKYNLD